jgi:DNA-binding CsgD family transcriptional regulator
MARESRYDAHCQLTPREREVRDLLRLGLTDAEIGDRLGVSKSAVSHHVSSIISKLGVANRYEAAHWPEPPPWWMGALAPVALLWRKSAAALPVQASSLALGVSGAALVTTLGGLTLIGVLLVLSNGDAPPGATAASPHVSGPGSAIDDAPDAETTARPFIRGDEPTATPAANSSQNDGPQAAPTERPREAAAPTIPAIAAAPPLTNKRGLMAVDCDASKAGVQAACRYAVGETFFTQVHIVRSPAHGYHGFRTDLTWDEGLAYREAGNPWDEILWHNCDFDLQLNPTGMAFGCVLYPAGVAGWESTGAVLELQFSCLADGTMEVGLLAQEVNLEERSYFIDGARNELKTDTIGARVVCATDK